MSVKLAKPLANGANYKLIWILAPVASALLNVKASAKVISDVKLVGVKGNPDIQVVSNIALLGKDITGVSVDKTEKK